MKWKERFYIKKIFFLPFLAFLIFPMACRDTPGIYENEVPVSPYGIKVYPIANNRFVLSYYVSNQENTFDGYNLYITRQSTKDSPSTAYVKGLTTAYLTNGSIPTFVHTKYDLDLNNYREVIIENYMLYKMNLDGSYSSTFVPFSPGTRYFFKLTGHSIFGPESEYTSNEVSAIASP